MQTSGQTSNSAVAVVTIGLDVCPTNGSGWCNGDCPENTDDSNFDSKDGTSRVFRGGSWFYDRFNATTRRRQDLGPGDTDSGVGGRLARSL